jgi:hypothetical protein
LEVFHDIVVSEFGSVSKVVKYADDVLASEGEVCGHLHFAVEPFFHGGIVLERFAFDDFNDAFGIAFETYVSRQVDVAVASFIEESF